MEQAHAHPFLLPDVPSEAAVAEHMGVPVAEILALIRTGRLPARRFNGRWFTTRRALLALIEDDPDNTDGPLRALGAGGDE